MIIMKVFCNFLVQGELLKIQMIKRIIFKFMKVYMANGHIYIHYLTKLHKITMPLNNDACS